MGTPKTLQQAIVNGLDEYRDRPADDKRTAHYFIRLHVKDFISQKFSVAILSDAQSEKMLLDLFDKVTK